MDIRPLTGPGELDLFNSFEYALNEEIPGDLSAGHRRPEWLWVAVRDGRVTARAAWWSRHGDEKPMFMDILDVAPGHLDDGVQLIEAAAVHAPEYVRFVPPDWRDHGHDWLHVLERSGARIFVERLRLQWQPGTPVRPSTGRLVFREPHDADELIGLMERVLDDLGNVPMAAAFARAGYAVLEHQVDMTW